MFRRVPRPNLILLLSDGPRMVSFYSMLLIRKIRNLRSIIFRRIIKKIFRYIYGILFVGRIGFVIEHKCHHIPMYIIRNIIFVCSYVCACHLSIVVENVEIV